jgi:hypothetical protein
MRGMPRPEPITIRPPERAQISFDLVMRDVMSFVEGTYRLRGREWQVFIFSPDPAVTRPSVDANARWESGVTGIHVKWPGAARLNRDAVLLLLAEQLDVSDWEEVNGPDSISLR